MAKNESNSDLPFYKRSGFIPTFILFVLLIILVLGTRLSGRPPQIDQITPEIGLPGDVMVIKGRFFGKERDAGEVEIGGITAIASDYLDWSDNEISVRIPDDVSSGMVFVRTRNGTSEGKLFTNRKQIPIVIAGPLKPGQPYIEEIKPENGMIGTLITINGINFGLEKGESKVFFTWVAEKGEQPISISTKPQPIAAREDDYDYEYWSDRELRVRVPDGASSGNIYLVTDKGRSNSVYFELKRQGGTKLFLNKKTYSIQYGLTIGDVSAEDGNGLYVWFPKVLETAEQKNIQKVSEEPVPMFPNIHGFSLFHFENLKSDEKYTIRESLIFDRYTVETKVVSSRVSYRYDTSSRLFEEYTSPNEIIPSNEKRIIRLARIIVGKEKNPYRRARLVYNYIRIRLKQSGERMKKLDDVIDKRKGDAYNYSMLFCALTRALGIPSRPVSGIVVTKERKAIRHYWNEFYLNGIGWLPVDSYLGDKNILVDLPVEINASNYYFGNLDNSHITFSKGVFTPKQMTPNGRRIKRDGRPDLLMYHEESVGNISSYSSYWHNIEVLGIY